MKEDGIGDLYKEYEELKNKLEKEGFFDNNHKQKIPFMPKTIGVLTSKTGSVIKDIINVSTRRNPNVHIRLFPIPVQGKGAELEIADAIRIMNEKKLADVLILARGGGSIEDLWPFNEEITARAIYNSKIPIISAVGHETDFTIADFVADLRAPTPSAAAELAVANIDDVKNSIKQYENRYKIALKKKIELIRLNYEKQMQRAVFKNPVQKINERYMLLDSLVKQIQSNIKLKVNEDKRIFEKSVSRLDALSPLKTLARGYSIVTKENDSVIKSKNDVKLGEEIHIKVIDGKIKAKVI